MEVLTSFAQAIQRTLGNISFAEIDHRWIILAFFAVAIALIVFSQEKHKAMATLLILYGLWFGALYVPAVTTWLEETLSASDLAYVRFAFGALPIVALLVLRKKRHVLRTPRS